MVGKAISTAPPEDGQVVAMDMGTVRSQWGNRGGGRGYRGGDCSGGDALPHPRMGRWLLWKLHESWFLVVAMDMGAVRSQWGNRGGGRGDIEVVTVVEEMVGKAISTAPPEDGPAVAMDMGAVRSQWGNRGGGRGYRGGDCSGGDGWEGD
ncbi:hypothetical protein C4D60_Mb07t05080 [Musa balbisiana]|uniref:Uncharacterized protein n=1 Tax=Musa balbisiana TaxID=52838 RepID=A0A4S8JEY0_MUSBA|nr:hypothetical protein C4D60_Mb07t05080 [Musa balbisiana]